MTHERIDRRSMELHLAIAEKLRQHPELMEIAHDNLRRWSATESHSKPYSDAWRKILKQPLEEILTLMLEDSERMTAMRHTSPFAGVLNPEEREAIFSRFRVSR